MLPTRIWLLVLIFTGCRFRIKQAIDYAEKWMLVDFALWEIEEDEV